MGLTMGNVGMVVRPGMARSIAMGKVGGRLRIRGKTTGLHRLSVALEAGMLKIARSGGKSAGIISNHALPVSRLGKKVLHGWLRN